MNELHKELEVQIEKFCEERIWPTAEHDDENEIFNKDIFTGLGNLGLCGMTLPSQFGGAELTYQDLCFVLGVISRYSVSYAVTLSVSTMVQSILNEFGTEEQKAKYLPALTSGQEIGAFSLSESHSGSDAANLKTTAKKTDGGYILNGTKMWVTSGGVAKTYIVMARTGDDSSAGISAFIVEDESEGFSYGKKEKKMGWRASPTRELVFENCFIPEENLLAVEGMGFKIAMAALNKGRITIGAIGVGLAESALKHAAVYALDRVQFNKPIYDFQGLQFMIADSATEVEASRYLVQKAAENYDNDIPDVKLAAMAKMKATDTAMKVTTDAVQILGGVGYTAEYPIERFMRDAKVLQIVEGTNQIQRLVIGREIKKELS